MTTTTPDAVEALAAAQRACWVYGTTETSLLDLAAQTIKSLSELGFTIARAEPAPKVEMPDGFKYTPVQQAVWDWWCEHQKAPPVCDDLNNLVWQLDKLKQDTAMSEAELLLHCQSLAMEFADDNLRKDCEQAAFELAKKYRGS